MEIDKIKIAAQNDLKEQISQLKKSNKLREVRTGFSNLIDNTSHLTRNKLSVHVGIYDDEIVIKPANLATVVFLEEGIIIHEKIVDVGKIKINDIHYFFETISKYGRASSIKKRLSRNIESVIVKLKDGKIYELNKLFHQKPLLFSKRPEKFFWLKDPETEEFTVHNERSFVSKKVNLVEDKL